MIIGNKLNSRICLNSIIYKNMLNAVTAKQIDCTKSLIFFENTSFFFFTNHCVY